MTDPPFDTQQTVPPSRDNAVQPPARRGFSAPSAQAREEARAQRTLLLVLRFTFLVLLVTVTLLVVLREGDVQSANAQRISFPTVVGLFLAATAYGVIVIVLDVKTPFKKLTSVVAVYLGLVAGLVAAIAIGALLDVVANAWELTDGAGPIYVGLIKVAVAITLCYLAISLVLTTKDDFRLVIPYVEFARQVRGIRPMLIDTSALIDGRVEGLGATGFLDAPLIVPQFVLDELQTLADSSDKLKRARGRRGLANMTSLQQSPHLDITVDSAQGQGHSVDHALLEMAGQQNLRILTTDFNLIKVAQIRGVLALNLNDLAGAMKSQAAPGETLHVDIVKPGEGSGQGVGYMPDGTMVVIEDAGTSVGETLDVVVTNSLQTSAGRMIFARRRFEITMPDDESGHSTERIADAATSQPRTTERPDRKKATTRRNPRR